MNIDEVKTAKIEMLKEIRSIVCQFEFTTGCSVESLELLRATYIGQTKSELISVQAEIKV